MLPCVYYGELEYYFMCVDEFNRVCVFFCVGINVCKCVRVFPYVTLVLVLLCVHYLKKAQVCWDSLPHWQTHGVSRNQLSGQHLLQVPLPHADTQQEKFHFIKTSNKTDSQTLMTTEVKVELHLFVVQHKHQTWQSAEEEQTERYMKQDRDSRRLRF